MQFLQRFDIFVSDMEAALMAKGEGAVQGEHVHPVEGSIEEVTRHVQVGVTGLQCDDTCVTSVHTTAVRLTNYITCKHGVIRICNR